jgi:hypothetical protein
LGVSPVSLIQRHLFQRGIQRIIREDGDYNGCGELRRVIQTL